MFSTGGDGHDSSDSWIREVAALKLLILLLKRHVPHILRTFSGQCVYAF
jgi:hypothetical protein